MLPPNMRMSDVTLVNGLISSDGLANCQKPCRPCVGTLEQSCVNKCLCELPECVVAAGRCVRNVFDGSDENATKYDEMQCVGREKSDPLPDEDLEDPVVTFKRRTAWAFRTWWDWPAVCEPPTEERPFANGGRYSARHDANQDFVLENVCIKGAGPLQGYKPQVEEFRGRDEVWFQGTEMRTFLSQVDEMPAPPKCLVDADLILMPMDIRVDNTVHTFARFLAVNLLQRFHFPKPGDPPHPHHRESTAAPAAGEGGEGGPGAPQQERASDEEALPKFPADTKKRKGALSAKKRKAGDDDGAGGPSTVDETTAAPKKKPKATPRAPFVCARGGRRSSRSCT